MVIVIYTFVMYLAGNVPFVCRIFILPMKTKSGL